MYLRSKALKLKNVTALLAFEVGVHDIPHFNKDSESMCNIQPMTGEAGHPLDHSMNLFHDVRDGETISGSFVGTALGISHSQGPVYDIGIYNDI